MTVELTREQLGKVLRCASIVEADSECTWPCNDTCKNFVKEWSIENLNETMLQAADMPEADEKRISYLEEQVPKWISVKDRLPERMQDVLVIVQMGDDCFYEVAALNKSLWLGLGNAYDIKCVTHWMPLPTPSKEE